MNDVPLPTTLSPFRIGPDWLTLSMSGPPSILDYSEPQPWIGGRWWSDSGVRTRVMSKVYYLTNPAGEKLLTVAGWPFSRAVGPVDWMLVQFANRTLHTGEFIELYQTLRSMGFVYKSTARLDLAADALEDTGGNYLEPIQQVWNGAADYYGKGGWRCDLKGRRSINYASLGSRAGNKYLRVYNKTRELKTAAGAHKADYIRAAWEACLGFDPVHEERTVNRLEIQTKGRELRRYFPEESPTDPKDADKWIEKLGDRAKVTDIYASLVVRMFDFRTRAYRARDAVPLVHWDFAAVSENVTVEKRETRTLALTDQAIKCTLQTWWMIAIIEGDERKKAEVMRVAEAAGLTRWLDSSIPRWQKKLDKVWRDGDRTMIERLGDLRL